MSANKLAAINAYNFNHNLLRQLEEKGETDRVLYLTTKWENARLEKRFPSLKSNLYV